MMNFKTFTAAFCGLLVALTAGAATGKKISDYTETLTVVDSWIYEIAVPGVTNYKVTFGAMATNIIARAGGGTGEVTTVQLNTASNVLYTTETTRNAAVSNAVVALIGSGGATNAIGNLNGLGTNLNIKSASGVALTVDTNFVVKGGKVGIGTNDPDATLDIVSPTGRLSIQAESDPNGAVLDLYFKHPTPTAGQRIAEIHSYSDTDNHIKSQMAAIYMECRDPSVASHDGHLLMNVTGSNEKLIFFSARGDTRTLELNAGNLYGDPTNLNFRVLATGTTNAIYMDGNNGFIGINHGAPGYRLTVVGTNTYNQLDAALKVYAATTPSGIATKAVWIGYNLVGNNGMIGAVSDGASHDQLQLNPHGGKVGINSLTNALGSALSVAGGLSVGTTFYQIAAPTGGAIIEGNFGLFTATPTNRLDVNGHTSLRSNVFLANLSTNAAPLSVLTLDGDGKVYETATSVIGSTQMVTAAIGTLTVSNALSVGTLNANTLVLTNFLTSNQVRLGVQQLTNVALANLQAGQSMVWNSSADKWTNANLMAANVISNITVTATNDLLLDFSMANIFKIRLLTNFSYRFTNAAYLLNKGYVYFQQDAVGVRLLNTFLVEGGVLQTNANMQPTTNALALDVLEVMPGLLTTNLICWWPQNFQPRVDFPGSSVATFTDNFDRQASDPMSTTASGGGTWTSGPGLMGDCLIEFNFLRGGTPSDNAARILSPTFATNQSARIQLANDAANFVSTGPMVRIQSTTDASGYIAAIQSTTSIKIQRVTDNGATVSYADIGLAFTVATLVVGDTVTLGISGTTLTLYVNGVSQGTRPDSTFLTGQPGIWFFNQIGIAENFYATDL